MNRLLKILIYIIFLLNCNCIYAKADKFSLNYAENCRNYLIQKQRFNAINYNALQLTSEQINQYEFITVGIENSYKEKLNEIVQEIGKYQQLKKNNVSVIEKYNRRKHIKQLYRDLSKLSHQENRQLKKIFNREQRRKFNMIKHLERHDLKKDFHPKNYHKLNPKMPYFGNIRE